MNDYLFNFYFAFGVPITFQMVDDGKCPFDLELAKRQVLHSCEYLNAAVGYPVLRMGEDVSEYPGYWEAQKNEEPIIYVRYVDEIEDSNFWAWCKPILKHGTQFKSACLSYRNDKVDTPEKFAGIHPHELGHALRLAHTPSNSIMQNQPYLDYVSQSMWQLNDLKRLGAREYIASCYDYGDADPDNCMIHIQAVEIEPGYYVSMYLNGNRLVGPWILTADPRWFRQEQPDPNKVTATIIGDRIQFPIVYMGARLDIHARIEKTNSLWEFVDLEIRA